MIAALFVHKNGPYYGLRNIDPWDIERDARLYTGPYPVIAHPPCERWGRYWHGGPSAKERRVLGDDDGCFDAALSAVLRWHGVLEHPEASHAWRHFGINRPPRNGGWIPGWKGYGWTCCVEQGHYGHAARKATWLFAMTRNKPEDLIWGPSSGKQRLDYGFHSAEERKACAHLPKLKRLTKKQAIETPIAFRDLLIRIAQS